MAKESNETTGHESPAAAVGQSLDLHTRGQANGKVGMAEEHGDTIGHDTPTAVAVHVSDPLKGSGWRLEARQAACIGRVSLRFLRELELEEPRREFEQKVGFLRRTEVNKGRLTRKN